MRLLAGLIALMLATAASATPPNVILSAEYSEPTTRYDHGILGDAEEWGALEITVDQCAGCASSQLRKFVIRLPDTRVFEDIAPRLVRLDDDYGVAVVVIESDLALGARLAIYTESGLLAATPFIGRSNRWLAPIGAADLDGDGNVELAYIDRPHLAKTLRIWRFKDGKLRHVVDQSGLTNHRIGQDFITGGVRNCAGAPELITVDAGWQNIMATRLTGRETGLRKIGKFSGPASVTQALACN